MRVASALAIAVAVLAALGSGRQLASAATPQLAFAPSSSAAAIGADVAVDITVQSVDPEPGLGGYDVALAFDPSIVHLTSLVDAGLVTQGQNIVVCNPATIDNAAGTASASCGTLPLFGNPGVSVSAPAPLLHAVLNAQAPGTSTLRLDGSTLEDPGGGALSASLASGSITIAARTALTATPAAAISAPSSIATGAATTPAARATAAAADTIIAPASPPARPASAPNGAATGGVVTLPATGQPADPEPGAGSLAEAILVVAGILTASAGVSLQLVTRLREFH